MVRRISRRLWGHAAAWTAREAADAAVSGCVFTVGRLWLRGRPHRLLSFGRRRLWKADVVTLGNEFSERGCADDRARASGAAIRIDSLVRDRRISVAYGNESTKGAESQGRDFL